MKSFDENRVYNGLPTMAVIFYNGRENWNSLKNIEKGYPEYWHGRILPYRKIEGIFKGVFRERFSQGTRYGICEYRTEVWIRQHWRCNSQKKLQTHALMSDKKQKRKLKHSEKNEEEKLNTAKKMVSDGIISVENAMSYFGYTKEQILD